MKKAVPFIEYEAGESLIQCGICGDIFPASSNHVCDRSEIPADERKFGRANCMYSVLCKEDKEQLGRIEAMLKEIIEGRVR